MLREHAEYGQAERCRLWHCLQLQGHSVVAIIFKGLPPHELGPAESASARSTAGDVEMTLHVLDDWHSPTLVAIRIKMPPGVARSLADQLASAAAEGEKSRG
jgi:hypothetical protein